MFILTLVVIEILILIIWQTVINIKEKIKTKRQKGFDKGYCEWKLMKKIIPSEITKRWDYLENQKTGETLMYISETNKKKLKYWNEKLKKEIKINKYFFKKRF